MPNLMAFTREQLDSAEKGTNLYTLIEKAAFLLHERIRNENPEENWSRAKEIISNYSHLNDEKSMSEELIKKAQYLWEERQILNHPGDQLEDWDRATESLAKEIVWDYFKWEDTR